MKIFAQLPAELRRAIARRELKRRGAGRPEADERLADAVQALHAALVTLLPFVPAARSAGAPISTSERRAALAARIAAGTTTTDDLAVLLALPADALALLGMSPAGYVTWLQSIDDSV